MGTFIVAIERTEIYDYEVDADSLAEAAAKAEILRHEEWQGEPYPNAMGGTVSAGRIVSISPPEAFVWHCPGCGWIADQGGDVVGHVNDCDLVDGMGRAVGQVVY